MIIECHHHFVTHEIIDEIRGVVKPEPNQVDKHLEWMDAAGIDVAVLSSPLCNTLEECKIADDAFGNMMEKHPNRFVGLARCIPSIGDESLKELDRAINVLGLRGVCIDVRIQGHNLDSEVLWPFYEIVSD